MARGVGAADLYYVYIPKRHKISWLANNGQQNRYIINKYFQDL